MTAERIWSTEQNHIFNWFATGEGHLIVRARAGTGKTTTIKEGVRRARENNGGRTNILLAAFNKTIADELNKSLAGTTAEAKTLHGLGMALIMKMWGRANVSQDRAIKLAERVCQNQPGSVADWVPRVVAKWHTKCREICPLAADVDDVLAVVDAFDLATNLQDDEDDLPTFQMLARLTLEAMELASRKTNEIDFADMIFLPLVNKWRQPRFDLVVIDEAQDMTVPQLDLALSTLRVGGRVVVVGDDRQAIYAFRGADAGSLDRLKQQLNAKELGLKTTYRCGHAIVAEARKYVPDLEGASTNPKGQVKTVLADKIDSMVKAGDFVLSRTNAPLTRICLTLLAAGKPAKIVGRDIGANLIGIVRRLKARTMTELKDKLDAWAAKQIKSVVARAANEEAAETAAAVIQDQKETILTIAAQCTTVDGIGRKLETLFGDADGKVIQLSTVHKAKGLEADNVFVLVKTFRLKGATGQEANLMYVAITRAKSNLYFAQ